ncbi:MAG: T9SS type A sorting domain-containing protein [Bacteroidetes bacterium]|nr:T9SS type A sorting domain-containing protein [Bacteroidota bacterium]
MKLKILWLCLFCIGLHLRVQSQTFSAAFTGPIPDNNTEICFPVLVSGLPAQIDATFGIVNVCIDISHSYVADLRITLKAPDNTTIVLANHVGGGNDNFTGTCLAEDGAQGYLVLGAAPFTGNYIPEQSLNLMNNGMMPNGVWQVCIIDEVPSDAGILNSASITFGANPPPDPPLPPGICSITNALGCFCPDTNMTDCDLLPDMTASALIIQNEHTEYPGYLTLSNATPNIGYGPLEVRGINVCYCDTVIVGCSTPLCPDGSYPKQLITQRVYHKNGQTMSFYDNPAGTMTYHPNHGHMHVDNWASYTLRVGTSNPDPLSWPLAGVGSKISFCLINLGSCSGSPGYCLDTLGNILTGSNIPNAGLGGVSGCGNEQGIFVGSLDIYGQGLYGQQIDFPGICNGDYFIISHTDPENYFLETNENNNYAVVPITLTQQGVGPLNPTFSFVTNGLTVDFTSAVPGVTGYQWYFGDGDSSNVGSVIHTFPAAGTYTVTLELFNGVCTSTVAQVVTVVDPVGLNEISPSITNLNIVPNPFTESTVVSYKLQSETSVKIQLYNLLGDFVQTVFDGMQQAGDQTMKIQNVPAGVYMMKISTPSANYSQRLVKLKY